MNNIKAINNESEKEIVNKSETNAKLDSTTKEQTQQVSETNI